MHQKEVARHIQPLYHCSRGKITYAYTSARLHLWSGSMLRERKLPEHARIKGRVVTGG